jgi:hypothetical protein
MPFLYRVDDTTGCLLLTSGGANYHSHLALKGSSLVRGLGIYFRPYDRNRFYNDFLVRMVGLEK